jgi:hypothetical protein
MICGPQMQLTTSLFFKTSLHVSAPTGHLQEITIVMRFNTCCFEDSQQHALNVITVVIIWRWPIGAETCSFEDSQQHVLNIITIVITWTWPVGAETCSFEDSQQHVLNVIMIVITWRWPVGAETCSEVLKNKEVVSCVCEPHIYNFILYVYIVYVSNATGCTPQGYKPCHLIMVKLTHPTYKRFLSLHSVTISLWWHDSIKLYT